MGESLIDRRRSAARTWQRFITDSIGGRTAGQPTATRLADAMKHEHTFDSLTPKQKTKAK
jgi:hypothetical protein